MSEWSKDMARRIREKKEENKLASQKSIQDKKIKDDALLHEWGHLWKRLKDMCAELNEEDAGVALLCDDSLDKIRVSRRGSSASIEGTYSPVTYQMEFSGKLPDGRNYSERFWIKLTDEGLGWVIVDAHDRRFTDSDIADRIISALADA